MNGLSVINNVQYGISGVQHPAGDIHNVDRMRSAMLVPQYGGAGNGSASPLAVDKPLFIRDNVIAAAKEQPNVAAALGLGHSRSEYLPATSQVTAKFEINQPPIEVPVHQIKPEKTANDEAKATEEEKGCLIY